MSVNMSVSNQPYSTMNGMTSNSIKSLFQTEGEGLIGSAKLCDELWEEMRKADFRKEGVLNDANIQLIYENKKKVINTLLKISSVEEFMTVFDDDLDGFLNEDEQIMVFTIITRRIQIIAEELCNLKRYELYKDLMKEVRMIEQQINQYQNDLRQNVHKKQLDDYINIGKEMQSEFDDNWERRHSEFDSNSKQDYQEKEEELKKEIDHFYQLKASKIYSLKVKPNHQIKLLSNQEKLVALNERVEEAVNFRNELMKLQKKDEERLDKSKREMIKNLNNKINKNETLEKKKIVDHIDKEKNKLIIKENKETYVLSKQINLHISDIVRIQNSLSNMYLNIGKKEDEMNRLKERQRKTNEAIATFKAVKSSNASPYSTSINKRDIALALLNLSGKTLSLNSSLETSGVSKFGSLKKNIIALKYMMRTMKLTRFDINSEFNSRKFCNVPHDYTMKNDNNLKKKIRKLLEQRHHKDEVMIPPSLYYDSNLTSELDARRYRELLPKLNPNV